MRLTRYLPVCSSRQVDGPEQAPFQASILVHLAAPHSPHLWSQWSGASCDFCFVGEGTIISIDPRLASIATPAARALSPSPTPYSITSAFILPYPQRPAAVTRISYAASIELAVSRAVYVSSQAISETLETKKHNSFRPIVHFLPFSSHNKLHHDCRKGSTQLTQRCLTPKAKD